METYTYSIICSIFFGSLCFMLAAFAINRRCQQLGKWASVNLLLTLIFIFITLGLLSNKKDREICATMPKNSVEYYLSDCSPNMQEYCYKVDKGDILKTVLYCKYCVPRTIETSTYRMTSQILNPNYQKCFENFLQ